MRIIDWSSDVCSSDLGNPHIQTSPENIARVAGPLSDKLAELDPADKADYARRYASFDTRWQAAMAKWTAEAAPLKGVAVVSAHKGWVYRSEEHTSELQSLMRISYAVFCLKKKKKTQTMH